jgi:hypothetical protein
MNSNNFKKILEKGHVKGDKPSDIYKLKVSGTRSVIVIYKKVCKLGESYILHERLNNFLKFLAKFASLSYSERAGRVF